MHGAMQAGLGIGRKLGTGGGDFYSGFPRAPTFLQEGHNPVSPLDGFEVGRLARQPELFAVQELTNLELLEHIHQLHPEGLKMGLVDGFNQGPFGDSQTC